ncbi:packaged DNA stabilization gp4 family protein [Citrobacter sp.]|uniref:packaged DNA stabilization gp4 family protein n=1 Tax=Citrobacter sp. TaxID=1896336 RepID=UPI0029043EE4|nr:packaged DNA stabilization gp4 family protein [Citrobacter sp.]EHG7888904.1 packaged DNA stabilization protein p27 [Citrobacter braakii]MDU2844931.1 packaged DNA stabilization gp4 family protein [Citrobacter sp.]
MATTLTKGEIVLFALRKPAIASNATLTDVEPQSVEDAIQDLENMMYEWQINPGEIGYIFSADGEDPLPDDDSGLPRKYMQSVGYQLMLRILSDYNLEPSPSVLTNAQRSYDALLTDTLVVPSMRRLGDFPVGQGNKYDVFTADRYYPGDLPPIDGDVPNP